MQDSLILEQDLKYKFHDNVKRKEQFSYAAAYTEAVNNLEIKEKTIFYESGFGKNTTAGPYAMFRTLYQDPQYKGYTHIWSLESLTGDVYKAFKRKRNVKFVVRKSKEYFDILATSKYIVNNRQMPFYYYRREGQYFIRLVQKFDDFMFENKYLSIKAMSYIRNLYQATHLVFNNDEIKEKVMSVNHFGETYAGKTLVHNIKKWDAVHEKPSEFAQMIGESVILKKKERVFIDNSIKRKKNILIYPGDMLPGGVTNSLINFLNEIDYSQYRVFLTVNKRNDQSAQEQIEKINPNVIIQVRYGASAYLEEEFIQVHRLEKLGFEKGLQKNLLKRFYRRELNRVCSRTSFDCAIDFSGVDLFWSSMIAFSNSKKKIIFMHTDMKKEMEQLLTEDENRGDKLRNLFSLYQRFDQIISVSPGCLEVNKTNFKEGIRDKITCIPDCVDAFRIKDLSNEQTYDISLKDREYSVVKGESQLHKIRLKGFRKVNKNNYNFIYLGKLSPMKEIEIILEAFAEAKKENPNVSLYIVGKGTEQASLESKITVLGIQDDVILTGHLDNPYVLMRQCDCLILYSQYEGGGLPVLEAMTLNKMVISVDIPGVHNLVEKGGGLLIQRSKDQLYQSMLDISVQKDKSKTNFSFEEYRENLKSKIDNLLEC